MAEHLLQRLKAGKPKTEPFLFDETNCSAPAILKRMQEFLEEAGEAH